MRKLYRRASSQISIIVLVLSLTTIASAERFNQCSTSAAPRTALDHFCPRVEGIHPDGCCPQVFKKPPLQCKYAVYLSRGQAFLANSSYTQCQNGANVTINCCEVHQRGCYRDLKTLDFLPRLLHREKACCFENCPSADYWRAPPANPNITPQHELVGSSPTMCTGTVLQECSFGTAANCQASDPCPPPPPPESTPGPSAPEPPGPTDPGPSDPGPSDPGPSDPGPSEPEPPPPAVEPGGT